MKRPSTRTIAPAITSTARLGALWWAIALVALPVAAQEPNLEALWQQGADFESFLTHAERQAEAWQENYERGVPDVESIARAEQLDTAGLRLLVVAEDWCSDSVDTIPYLARAVAAIDGLEMRIVGSEAGAAIMETYRTPDDRGATPTVVLLGPSGEALGAWVERPVELQDWFIANHEGLRRRDLMRQKHAWYVEDHGRSTVREILDLIESAGERRPSP